MQDPNIIQNYAIFVGMSRTALAVNFNAIGNDQTGLHATEYGEKQSKRRMYSYLRDTTLVASNHVHLLVVGQFEFTME